MSTEGLPRVHCLKLFALVSILILPIVFASQAQQGPPATPPRAQPAASPTPLVPVPPTTVNIDDYRAAAARIIGAALTSDRAYTRLAHLTDAIGNRMTGSENPKRAIEWAATEMKRDGLDNVRREKVMVPRWVPGEESLELLTPVPRKLQLLGRSEERR